MSDTTRPVALVTGGAQGIGKGIAKRLRQEDFQVIIADLDENANRELISETGAKITVMTADVADEDAVKSLLIRLEHDFGRLDVLINNAGIARAHRVPLEQLELGDWNRMLATNLTGIFLCSKYAIPLLRRSRGTIVNLASTRAMQSEPDTEAYSATKGGVIALTHAMAVSLGPDIRVNCISPGWIDVAPRGSANLRQEDHAQHPAGRVGTPEDIAAMAAYLCSKQATFITGQNFVVDGGMTRKMIYLD